MDRVRDVGWSRCQPTCRSHADANGCDDERRPCSEGRQDEAGNGGDGPRDAGYSASDTGGDGLLVERVSRVGQSEQLQDTLLEGGATLVEKADEKTSRHEDTIGCFSHDSEWNKEEKHWIGLQLSVQYKY